MDERIKANAELVIPELRPLSGIDFGYNRESEEWLEGYIKRWRQSNEPGGDATREKLANVCSASPATRDLACRRNRQQILLDNWNIIG
jgi:hypothetical protein